MRLAGVLVAQRWPDVSAQEANLRSIFKHFPFHRTKHPWKDDIMLMEAAVVVLPVRVHLHGGSDDSRLLAEMAFSRSADTTTRGQRARGIKTAKLKEGKTFTHSKTPIYWKSPECRASREEFRAPLWTSKRGKKKNQVPSVIFIKQSSFTPSASRPQLQGNQMHLFSPEERSSLTAAFSLLLVKCTHSVALFSCQSHKNARRNCSDTVMTRNIQICTESRRQT